MKLRRFVYYGCAAIMAAALIGGCTGQAGENSNKSAEEGSAGSTDSAGTEREEEAAADVVVMKVTAVDGNTVTGETGTLTESGQMPDGAGFQAEQPGEGSFQGERPDGAAGGGSAEDGTAEGPSGEGMPQGGMPGIQQEGGPQGGQSEGGSKGDRHDGGFGGGKDGGRSEGAAGEMPEGMSADGGREGDRGTMPGEMPDGQPGGQTDGTDGGMQQGERPQAEGDFSGAAKGQAPDGGELQEDAGGGAPEGAMPESVGEMPDGQPGGGMMAGGYSFEGSGEEISFTLTDDTAIVLEYLQGEGEGTVDDIQVGAVLEVTADENGSALTVTVKNLNRGGGFGGSDEVTNGTSANTIDEDADITGGTYTSEGDDENALRIDEATVSLADITVEKTGGETSNRENGDFYGLNAGLLALNGAEVTISGANVSTSAVNGNGVFSYGEGTVINITDSVIRTTADNSGGIQTTGGGTTIASNLDIETQGNSAAAIRSDRGGGTVQVTGGTYVTNGTGSPAIYCTADISAEAATLTANSSEAVVIEGKNSVALKDCTVTADMDGTYGNDDTENIHAVMIYQSMSGDAQVGKSYFSADGGSITAKTGDMFYVTNTSCEISLSGVSFTPANDIFLRIEGNSSPRGWGTQGSNGGDVVLNAVSQEIEGNILADEISSLVLSLTDGSSLTGAVNPDGEGGQVEVSLDSSSTWTLTADSYITSFNGDPESINAGSFHLYVDGEQLL